MSSTPPLAKTTARLLLALTFAFSICFPLPLEKAHALDGRSAPAESNTGSSYVDNDATVLELHLDALGNGLEPDKLRKLSARGV